MFPDPIINGQGGADLNELQLTFTPFVGGQQGGTYEGPDAVILPLISSLTAAGYSVEYHKSQSPISKLTFSAAFNSIGGGPPISPNTDYTDTWELVRNSVQKELLESDHPYVSELSSSDFDLLKAAFQSNSTTVPAFSGAGTPGILPGGGMWTTADSIAAGTYLFKLNNAGVKTIEVKQPILKLTRTTSQLYTLAWAVGNSDSIMTTATMLADSGLPATFSIPMADLETRLIARSGGLLQQARTDGIILNFGWQKDFVGSTKHGKQRIQFNLEYKFGLWDFGTYGAPI